MPKISRLRNVIPLAIMFNCSYFLIFQTRFLFHFASTYKQLWLLSRHRCAVCTGFFRFARFIRPLSMLAECAYARVHAGQEFSAIERVKLMRAKVNLSEWRFFLCVLLQMKSNFRFLLTVFFFRGEFVHFTHIHTQTCSFTSPFIYFRSLDLCIRMPVEKVCRANTISFCSAKCIASFFCPVEFISFRVCVFFCRAHCVDWVPMII